MTQTITSAKTSLHQLPALHRKVSNLQDLQSAWVLDYGAGRYDKGVQFLRDQGAEAWAYDPYNRPSTENREAIDRLRHGVIDIALCANVLNVINCPHARLNVITDMALAKQAAYFSVHEGDKSSIERQTNRGYQRNMRVQHYLPEILSVFDHAKIFGGNCILAWNDPEDAKSN